MMPVTIKRTWIVLLLTVLSVETAAATVERRAESDSLARKTNVIGRFLDYLNEDSVEREVNARKRFSISVLGGPSYSSDTKFNLGVAGVVNYRLKGCEYPLQASSLTLSGSVSTAKFWSLSAVGPTLMAGDRRRLNTDVELNYLPLYFWGMGYENALLKENKSMMHELRARIHFDYLWRLAKDFYVGPGVEWSYSRSGTMERPELLEGQDAVVRNYGVGLTIQFDSRDLVTNAWRGLYLYGGVMFRPRFLWNHYAFTTLDLRACYYRAVWQGGVLAGEVRGLFNLGSPSWAMLARLGDTSTMRGYYRGRFRDKHMATVQVELRQHVWKRSGLVVWGGCGSVFHDGESFRNWLPNYGLGYRWEFRNRVNVRLDYGFGSKGENGFMFSINEAF